MSESSPLVSGRPQNPAEELRTAAKAGDAARVRQLLAEGAEPALADDGGVTPLMLAAESGSAEAVAALLGGLCACS